MSAALRTADVTPGAIKTFTGKLVMPLELQPDEVCLEDIAHSISNQCRFTGHTRRFYSVGQHSMLVALYVWEKTASTELALAGLFHDASEAYLLDLPAPLKRLPEFAMFKTIEHRIQATIEARFGFTPGIFEHPWVKRADKVLQHTEKRDLMAMRAVVEQEEREVLDFEIIPSNSQLAERSWWDMGNFLAGDLKTLVPGRERAYSTPF